MSFLKFRSSCCASGLALLVASTAACSDNGPGNATTLTSHTTFPSSDPTTPGTSEPAEPTTGAEDTGSGSQSATSAPTTGDPSGDPSGDPTGDPSGDPTGDPTGDTSTGGPNEDDGPLCQHLGGVAGISALIEDFLDRVLVDDRINAYFLTKDVDGGRLAKCLKAQIGAATMCSGVVYDCEDMQSVHAGMGISQADFNDLGADFSDAMDAHQAAHPNFSDDEKAAILGVLGTMAPEIVEDESNDITTYQRVGRKPGIAAVIGDGSDPDAFIAIVGADAAINGFFGKTDVLRLQTCLVRQITSVSGGPNIYGKEVDAPAPADPGVGAAEPCRDMVSSHKSLKDVKDGLGVEFMDFVALATDLLEALGNFGVPAEDQNAILGALGPLCSQVVTVDPGSCP